MDKEFKSKSSISVKITLMVCLVIFIIATIGIILGYFWAFNLLRDTVVGDRIETANVAASAINNKVIEVERNMLSYLSSPFWKNAIIESNLKYENMGIKNIQDYLLGIDAEWINPPAGSLLVEEYLNNEISLRLKALVRADNRILEIILTDKYGGLVAASGRTTDFYQADEPWWQEAFNAGNENIHISNIVYDESAGALGIDFAMPVRDETGKIIGVCKCTISPKNFFDELDEVKIGKTGHAGVINENDYILFHEDIQPLTLKYLHEKDFNEVFKNKKRWVITNKSQLHNQKMLVVFSRVEQPLLLRKGIVWIVFIDQEEQEAFSHLKQLILQAGILSVLLIILMIPMGIILGRYFVKPIKKIQEATGFIASGNLDYRINIDTSDEIGQLADSFNKMARDLKKSNDIIALHTKGLEEKVAQRTKELSDLNLNLENRVKERTAELTKSQTAMLYMIEDLNRQAKEIKEAQDKLVRAEKLAVIGQLASSVAHELRNPLGVMKNVVYYFNMLGLSKDNVDIKENLEILSKEIEGANKIIGDLLEFSRVKKPILRPENINVIVREVINRLKVPTDIKVVTELSDNLPDIPADALQIQQVFYNIATNGIQAMEKGGELKIKTELKGGNVEASFIDTGTGISKENIDKIFDPLFSTKAKGTGLGLSVCASLVEGHKGEITVESQEGKGSVFVVKLPV